MSSHPYPTYSRSAPPFDNGIRYPESPVDYGEFADYSARISPSSLPDTSPRTSARSGFNYQEVGMFSFEESYGLPRDNSSSSTNSPEFSFPSGMASPSSPLGLMNASNYSSRSSIAVPSITPPLPYATRPGIPTSLSSTHLVIPDHRYDRGAPSIINSTRFVFPSTSDVAVAANGSAPPASPGDFRSG